MRIFGWLAVVGIFGCGADGASSDVDPDTAATGCVVLPSGSWRAEGDAFGVSMVGTLTMDEAACTFTLGDWDVARSAPTGGAVSGDEVTLRGDAYWETCTGTVDDDKVDGACGSDGFELDFDQ